MEFTQNLTHDGIVVSLSGSFTFQDHRRFRTILDLLHRNNGDRKTLDLSRIEFMDSAALGLLLIAEDEISSTNSTLTLRNLSAQIQRLFALSAMDSVFSIERP